ncbi:MAG TPA: hypothetical protein VGE54_05315 [Brevundimonas sp.]
MKDDLKFIVIVLTIDLLCALLFFNLTLDDSINLGPLGTWVSGIGSLIAVLVALNGIRRTDERELEKEDRETLRRKVEKEEKARVYVTAVREMLRSIRLKIRGLNKLTGEPQKAAAFERAIEMHDLDDAIAALDKLPLHQAPNHELIEFISRARTAARVSRRRSRRALERARTSDTGEASLTLVIQLAVIESVWSGFNKTFKPGRTPGQSRSERRASE